MPLAVDIRAERLNRGLSVADAAAQMNVDRDTLARAETGKTDPHPRNAIKIAGFFGYRVTDVWPLPANDEAVA